MPQIELLQSPIPNVAEVRLNDWLHSPNYTAAYTAAWQSLLPRAHELAIPILYLQRHTLELVAKDLLKFLLSIRKEMRLSHDIFGVPASAAVIDRADWEVDWQQAHDGHSFGPLFTRLSKNLALLELPPLPEDFAQASELFEKLDNNNASRWRYRTVRGKPKNKQVESFESSLSREVVADIGKSTRLLNRIVLDHVHFDDDDAEDSSFLQAIIDKSRLVNFDLREHLDALEKATRQGDVASEVTREPPLPDEDFSDEDRLRLSRSHLVTTYAGRRLVIFLLRDGLSVESTDGTSSRENAFGLACQRLDGKMPSWLWPSVYESNVVPEALDSNRRRSAPSAL